MISEGVVTWLTLWAGLVQIWRSWQLHSCCSYFAVNNLYKLRITCARKLLVTLATAFAILRTGQSTWQASETPTRHQSKCWTFHGDPYTAIWMLAGGPNYTTLINTRTISIPATDSVSQDVQMQLWAKCTTHETRLALCVISIRVLLRPVSLRVMACMIVVISLRGHSIMTGVLAISSISMGNRTGIGSLCV